jgi:TrmH RNA methyltransferase
MPHHDKARKPVAQTMPAHHERAGCADRTRAPRHRIAPVRPECHPRRVRHAVPDAIRKLYLAEARIPQLQPLLKWCVANHVGYRVVEEGDLQKLAASSHHEGVVADVLREEPAALTTWLRELPDGPLCALWLDGVRQPAQPRRAILRSQPRPFGGRR